MDLRYVLLNVHSKLPACLLRIYRVGTSAPARARTLHREEPGLQTSVIICILYTAFWTRSTNAPPRVQTPWENDKEGRRNRGGGVGEADRLSSSVIESGKNRGSDRDREPAS